MSSVRRYLLVEVEVSGRSPDDLPTIAAWEYYKNLLQRLQRLGDKNYGARVSNVIQIGPDFIYETRRNQRLLAEEQ